MSDEQQHLTQEWYNKLADELHDLKINVLPEILVRLKDSIAQGDISENAEYETAQNDRNMVEARIKYLEKLLADATIIDASSVSDDIRYGSKVTIHDIERDKEYNLTVVWTGEVDTFAGQISFQSPLGIALRGKKVWQTVKVNAPKWKYEIKILSVG